MEVNKSFVLAAVLAFGLTALASEVAAAPRAIIACTTITLPGSYQLSKNLHAVGNCLVVGVNFVTIDLGGFTIFGNGSGMGIMAVGVRRGIVIRNGLITNFFDGIDLASSREIVVENLRAIANVGSGIRIGASSSVTSSTSSGNTNTGISVATGLVTGCIADFNLVGITAIAGSQITGNRANGNTTAGIDAPQASTVIGNTANGNAFGLSIDCPSNVIENTVRGNGVNLSLLGAGCNSVNNLE